MGVIMQIKKIFSTLAICFLIILVYAPTVVSSQDDIVLSTSPTIHNATGNYSPTVETVANNAITFSEYSVGTSITTQYASQGIIFEGDSPFISTDWSNPTSPVLSGTPIFKGAIEGRFVNPSDINKSAIVESFSLDAGYFDELGSTRIEWFDPNGKKLGQRTNIKYGIERFNIQGGNIARFRISIIENEPAGYAIDNVSFQPIQASILFRESLDDKVIGTWGIQIPDEIPGWDHTAFNLNNVVYESHPGYLSGVYISEDGQESVPIQNINGAQAQFTVGTFKHESTNQNTTLIDFEEIPIDIVLAEKMKAQIENQIAAHAKFRFIDYSLSGLVQTLAPYQQKGGDDGAFTCVGLVEWSAEHSGHNGGEGFIRNEFESIGTIPLLSPQLLNYALKYSNVVNSVQQWYQGLFDPVDFMITDPLGRKLGYVSGLGEKNEIPGAFYTGDGKVEQFFIPNPVGGNYLIEYYGLDQQVIGAMSTSLHSEEINGYFARNKTKTSTFVVELVPGSPGDINHDGVISQSDIDALNTDLNTFTNSTNDPRDIDGDGLISSSDLALLGNLLNMPTFADVASNYWAWQYIERLYNSGITGGCSTNPLSYCPTNPVTRAQMAVFLLKGIHGSSFTPPAVGGSTGFSDVDITHWAAAWIKQLAAESITGGCGSGIYCPENTVTRAQMAVFLLKAMHGASYSPPNVSPTFGDTSSHWAEDWIEQLAVEGITSGCAAGLYCPENPVTRDQMAVFLVKAFNLP